MFSSRMPPGCIAVQWLHKSMSQTQAMRLSYTVENKGNDDCCRTQGVLQ